MQVAMWEQEVKRGEGLIAQKRCDEVTCMTEIVLKDLAGIYLPQSCKAISLRGKIKVCYPNVIFNLNACICSCKLRICKFKC